MNREELAQEIVDHIADHMHAEKVHRFTPSIKQGRRYVALTIGNTEYLVTVEVDAIEPD